MSKKDPKKQAAHSKRHYENNKEQIKLRSKEAKINVRKRNFQYVRDYKTDKPCTDCGVVYPPYVLQFDHINDDKISEVANMSGQCVSIATIQKEIDKCELVCANCHAIRTFTRRYAQN